MNVKGVMDIGNKIVVKEDVDADICNSISLDSISEDSMNSVCSASLSELAEEASSSTSSLSTTSSSSHSNGPLYELSDLMNHLPLKRGLSMFYEGKTQSFSSLARVQSIEDIPKKERTYRKKIKSCNSYGGGLDGRHRISYNPKATISKKASRGPNFVSVISRRGSFLGGSRPSFAVHKNYSNPL